MRKARRVSTLFHIVFTSLAIAACTKGTPDAKQTQAPPERADKPSDSTIFRVALLTPGPISDQSWNGGAYKGLMRFRDSLGATVSHIQTKTPAEFEEQFRQYGAQGYDLVFLMAASSYLFALLFIHLLAPALEPATLAR